MGVKDSLGEELSPYPKESNRKTITVIKRFMKVEKSIIRKESIIITNLLGQLRRGYVCNLFIFLKLYSKEVVICILQIKMIDL